MSSTLDREAVGKLIDALRASHHRVEYLASPVVPKLDMEGQPTLLLLTQDKVWLLHPDNLPAFKQVLTQEGYQAVPVDREAWAERTLAQLRRRGAL